MVAHGMPPLLFAGILLTSTEGRSRSRPVEGFGLYRKLAVAHKLAVRLRSQLRLPLPWTRPVLWLARLAAFFHRRWDANNLARWQLQSLRNTLASWQPVLERQAGQLGAAQLALQVNQQGLDTLRQELTVARARLNALGHVGHAAYMPSSSQVIGQNPGQGVSTIAKQEAHAEGQLHTQAALASELDAYYLAFEDAHRASARDMRLGFQAYQPLLDSLKAKDQPMSALDLGCGRGEWLVFLAEQGFDARGIDASQAMVAHCQAQGLQVDECDLLQALRGQPDGSLNLITAFHVAEHLDFATLYSLVAQAWRVLKPGGALLLETPNPENPLVGSHTFYHDPTHRNPLTPSALGFLLGYHGFERLDVLRLNPYPQSARVPGEDLLTERINGLLCGPQDFAVVGRRPGLGPESPPSMASSG
jgi:O-antigen chain-terminating methyltransferase